ncbi:glycosyltransferase [Clostridium sp. ASBs410]|jgi:glycosyltransferase involved in cell wall biosynthesis|nr:glycosyltransferase [Clostridium sp. ASBs410]
MAEKVLVVTTTSGFVPQFEMNNVKYLQLLGYEVHYASNYRTPVYGKDNSRLDGTGIIRHQVDFVRSPFRLSNIKVLIKLVKLMKKEQFALIHCHTPMGGVLGRIAAWISKCDVVMYTAHGFHFYQGAPLINQLLYKTMEWTLAHMTDILVTINQEDYKAALKFKLKKDGAVFYVPGIGIDCKRFYTNEDKRQEIRSQYQIQPDDFILITCGELIKRKNHEAILKALTYIKDHQVKLILCGSGVLEQDIRQKIRDYDLEDRIIMIGYCYNILDHLKAADCFVFPSYQEGLPVALMEAMASGLPVVCSKIRGNVDLIIPEEGGFLVDPRDIKELANSILKLKENHELKIKMGLFNAERIQKFDVEVVNRKMRDIYQFAITKGKK